ncbi:MAG: XdhC/CoxI family protein [Elusimicrobia bacterium]|nr:XdhC/CoxI family protein [Elusimicrobiota bacterium]
MKDIYAEIALLRENNRPFVLTTLVNTSDSVPQSVGAKMVVLPDGKIFGTIGGGCLEKNVIREAKKLMAAGAEKTLKIVYNLSGERHPKENVSLGMLCGGQAEIMFEVFASKLDLVICGAGHIAEKLAAVSDMLNLSYAVIDNRQEFASKDRFPGASAVICGDFPKAIKGLEITGHTSIVIVTYGHVHDYECLEASLTTPAFYIGMIGSRNKAKELFARLKNKKIKITGNVYSPVGLDVGGNSPAEISISIISEILKIKYGTTGKSLRLEKI